MDSTFAHAERTRFCHRLNDAMIAAGYPASATVLVRVFNPRADGAAVSVHGARKWLTGTAFPTQERLQILARVFNVSAQWLRYGEGDPGDGAAANDGERLPFDEALLLNDFRCLDERSQQVVRDLVTSLLKHHSLRT